ncbi:DUF7146 domain-containing protein [Pararhizobium mangrovi]|uniref:DNA primase n=1 Tax=Pararhizobium mangrovi TaxID=2590452 RepID=A0A506U077_9HYPH|nr:toprim domain-containing protein [Pararhizobium mangrovi]TPW27733.1 DNA primase [Pararhizobium mangrovi]
MESLAADLARRLADRAEAVCRHYLSNGRRHGRYWLVGDVDNTPGRSLYVRLWSDSADKPAGKWTDAATGEHGDLLDLIAANRRTAGFADTLDEARRFLALPEPETREPRRKPPPAPSGSPEAARRLFAMAQPIAGTLAETYLHERGITDLRQCRSLRFHPRCWYRGDKADQRARVRDAWPAMIAAVTGPGGHLTGVQRTWLALGGGDKAPVSTPRRAMGDLLGNAVRFGPVNDVMVAGEGIETLLSLRQVLPTMPMAAALSANHLTAIDFPAGLRRLYIARDDDAAGIGAARTLIERAVEAGIEAVQLIPELDDFNDDLRAFGVGALADWIRPQLVPEDVARFWTPAREARTANSGKRMIA